MRALFLSCTLKLSPEASNTEALAGIMMHELSQHGVEVDLVRLVDLDIKPGVKRDEGNGDAWPQVDGKIRNADMLVIATPTWMGHMSSVAQRAIERLDSLFSELDEAGRTKVMGKVAGLVITGNEDGAHHIVGTVSQALIDLGFTVPGQSWTYWHLGPGAGPDYLETEQAHDYSGRLARNAAHNLLHVAKALAAAGPFPMQARAPD